MCALQGFAKVVTVLKKCSCMVDAKTVWECFGIARNSMDTNFHRCVRSVIDCPFP